MMELTVFANSLSRWLAALTTALAVLLALYLVERVVLGGLRRQKERTGGAATELAVEVLLATRVWILGVLALYAGVQLLTLPARLEQLVTRVAVVALLLQVALWAHRAVGAWLAAQMARREAGDAAAATTTGVLAFLARIAVWSLILLMVLANLGFDITALVASLGIGGIAVALAVQNILGDLFASLSIALDKPVAIGDFVVVGEVAGTVDYVGIKTTRLRSISGEQIVVANSDLVNSRIRNFKRMFRRRILFGFGVTYQTAPEMLARIPAMVERIVKAQQAASFDRAHFKAFGASALEFEVVYFVEDPDYRIYMDVQQAINLALLRELSAEGVEFAYPTQTIHLATVSGTA